MEICTELEDSGTRRHRLGLSIEITIHMEDDCMNNEKTAEEIAIEAIKRTLEADDGIEQTINSLLDDHWGDDIQERIKSYLWLLSIELIKLKARSIDNDDAMEFTVSLKAAIHTLLSYVLEDNEDIQIDVLLSIMRSILEESGASVFGLISGSDEDEEEGEDLLKWI